jgi:F-type H+-transporting ATPase subunit delta
VKNLAIARRYAKAMMLIGKEDDQMETYREELNRFADLIAGQKDLERAINNPLYSTIERKKVLKAILEKLNLSRVTASFLLLLFDKGRIKHINDTAEVFDQLADDLKGITRASLTSATDLSSETVDEIRASIAKMTGKNVILEHEQDPGLIGGVVTRIGDLVIDGSIKTQLLNMRQSLKRGERV